MGPENTPETDAPKFGDVTPVEPRVDGPVPPGSEAPYGSRIVGMPEAPAAGPTTEPASPEGPDVLPANPDLITEVPKFDETETPEAQSGREA